MSFVVVLFSVVHKWYSILFIIAELQFTVIIYGYLIPREKLQKFSRDKTICTKYNSTFSIFQNSNMKENFWFGLQICSWLMIIAGDFHFFQKWKIFWALYNMYYTRYTYCLHTRKLSYLYFKSLLSKKKKVKYVHLSILRNFSRASNLHECCLGRNSGLNCL